MAGKIAPRQERHLHVQPTMSVAKLYQGLPPRSRSRSRASSSLSRERSRSHTANNRSLQNLPEPSTSQFSKLPTASEKLLKTRQEAIPIRRIEKRDKVDRDFLSQFSFDVDPDAEVYCKVLYGPLPVRAQSDSRSIKVCKHQRLPAVSSVSPCDSGAVVVRNCCCTAGRAFGGGRSGSSI